MGITTQKAPTTLMALKSTNCWSGVKWFKKSINYSKQPASQAATRAQNFPHNQFRPRLKSLAGF